MKGNSTMNRLSKVKPKINLNEYCDFCYENTELYPVLVERDDPESKLYLCEPCARTYKKTQENMKKRHEDQKPLLKNAVNGILNSFKFILS